MVGHKWQRHDEDDSPESLRLDWYAMCQKIPFALGTDCKSLYDVCTKQGSMPDEKRVALDLLDVRESIEQMEKNKRFVSKLHYK